ncbi:MAG: hypothetical protein OXK77_12535 [Gemmatimonadota bacterium]|nr:hypothetical protein [Gemmatimonadota bacterium]MDE2864107.1 hypothetical protein [Gemmatimonadota bacterium]
MSGTDLGMVVGFATLAFMLIAFWMDMEAEMRGLRHELELLREAIRQISQSIRVR